MFRVCPACGALDWASLPAMPGGRSMLSDGRVIGRPLDRVACQACGYAGHAHALGMDDLAAFYDDDYDLSLQDEQAAQARGAFYLGQIETLLDTWRAARVLEFGCGSGAFLDMLNRKWGCERATGTELAAQLAHRASQREGLEVVQGASERHDGQGAYDLCLSINVIEHAQDPLPFLLSARRAIKADGRVLVICPNGDAPSQELLFIDHVSSFSAKSLVQLARQAGLAWEKGYPLPGNADFQAHLFRPAQVSVEPLPPEPVTVSEREHYLRSWIGLEESVRARLAQAGQGPRYAVFGCGELSQLLNCYAPALLYGAECFVLDRPAFDTYLGKPVRASDAPDLPRVLLVAVHRAGAATVAARLRERGFHPILLEI